MTHKTFAYWNGNCSKVNTVIYHLNKCWKISYKSYSNLNLDLLVNIIINLFWHSGCLASSLYLDDYSNTIWCYLYETPWNCCIFLVFFSRVLHRFTHLSYSHLNQLWKYFVEPIWKSKKVCLEKVSPVWRHKKFVLTKNFKIFWYLTKIICKSSINDEEKFPPWSIFLTEYIKVSFLRWSIRKIALKGIQNQSVSVQFSPNVIPQVG